MATSQQRGRGALVVLGLVSVLAAVSCSSADNAAPESTMAPTSGGPSSVTATTESSTETTESSTETIAPTITSDRAYYILPPGNYGGIPTNEDSLDQLALYDGLTPLRGDVTDADIEEYFLPADFEPVGETVVEETGRPGTTIVYDEYGIPHITGETRDDLAFGAGWVTARDRALLLDMGRGPSRVAVADVPGGSADRRGLWVDEAVGDEQGDREAERGVAVCGSSVGVA